MSELLKPIDAAQLAGVSYPTLKQWIYKGKIRTTKTAGGHHRIARSEIERVTGTAGARTSRKGKPVGLDSISGRNKLPGTITEIRYEGLLVQVTIDVAGLRDHLDHYQRQRAGPGFERRRSGLRSRQGYGSHGDPRVVPLAESPRPSEGRQS